MNPSLSLPIGHLDLTLREHIGPVSTGLNAADIQLAQTILGCVMPHGSKRPGLFLPLKKETRLFLLHLALLLVRGR